MAKQIQAVRGMNDILPNEAAIWQTVEHVLQKIAASYGYQEIRFPIVEHTALFQRSVGEATDIVEKEMYTFIDRSGDSLTLRPEGTAGCVRAGIEHGLFYNQTQRLWYLGPIFRHERPQKGRYRQFYQFGVEAFGIDHPAIDAEIILLGEALWRQLKLSPYVKLQINSLGGFGTRKKYCKQLVDYFSAHRDQLDEDCLRRLTTNPLRILDSKNPALENLIASAPKMLNCLSDEAKAHFDAVCSMLTNAGVEYEINPCLVRGLDYYTHTVFEWVTDKLGAQSAVCAGGRFDYLVENLGGKPTSAIGFALGMERLIALLIDLNLLPEINQAPDIYFVLVKNAALSKGLLLAERWRKQFPNLNILSNCEGGSFKSQFKKADKSGATFAFILGEDELQSDTITIKHLRERQEQVNLPVAEVEAFLGLRSEE